jgi:capsule polysaccharide export protein KpsE/RkpR
MLPRQEFSMIESQNNPTPPNEETNLLDYLIVLAKYSRLIIYTTAAVMVLGCLMLFILSNKYTSTARLLPPQQNLTLSAQLLDTLGGGGTPGAPAVGGGASSLAAGLLGLKSPSELYAGMLTSNTIFDRIIERFDLRRRYKEHYIEEARKALGRKTSITAQKDGMIVIEVTDKDPKRAADMANAFIEELDKLIRGMASQEAKNRLVFMEKERLQTSQNLSNAENALRSFSEQNNVLQIDTQTRGVLGYIAQLRAEIDAKEVGVQVMLQQATPSNYDVVRLKTEIKGLRDKLSSAEKQYDQGYSGDTSLTTAKVPILALEYMRLYRELKFRDTLNQLFTKMVELARLDMVKDFSVMQIVDKGIPPEKNSNKRLLKTMLIGVVTAFIMIFLSFIIENWRNKPQSAADAEKQEELMKYLRPWVTYVRRLFPFLKSKKI